MIVELWKFPKDKHAELKEAYENMEYFWLIKQWNESEITFDRLCPTCPQSIDIIKEHIPQIWTKKN